MCHLENVTGRGSTLVCADYWTTTAASLFTRPIIILYILCSDLDRPDQCTNFKQRVKYRLVVNPHVFK